MRPRDLFQAFRDAIDQALDDRLIDLLERYWGYLVQTNNDLLRESIQALPDGTLEQRPIVALAAESVEPMTPQLWLRGERQIERVLRSLEDIGDEVLLVGAGQAAVIALRRRGRTAEAATLGARLCDHPGLNDDVTSAASAMTTGLYIQSGLCHLLTGNLEAAERLLGTVARKHNHLPNYTYDASSKLAFIAVLRGQRQQAEGWIQRALDHDPAETEAWYRGLEGAYLHVSQAWLCLDRLDWAGYQRHVNAMDGVIQDEAWGFLLHVRGRAALLLGDQPAMINNIHQFCDRFPGLTPVSGTVRRYLNTIRIDLLMNLGQMDEAGQLVASLGDSPLELITQARFDLLTRNPDGVEPLADVDTWPTSTTRRDKINLLLLAATALMRLRAQDARRDRLIKILAVETAYEDSWLYTFALADQDVVDLLAEQSAELAVFKRRLAELEALRPFRPQPVPLTKREQDVLEHLVANLPISQIASMLHVAESTIRNQRKTIYRKLGARTRDHAIEIALRTGLVPPRGAALPSLDSSTDRAPSHVELPIPR